MPDFMKHVREVTERVLIDKFCSNCQKSKSHEGGGNIIQSNGYKRWKCKECLTIIRNHRKKK
jgi:hypothetical protein